jgi:thiol-disulfide isomerase/thioredoxin
MKYVKIAAAVLLVIAGLVAVVILRPVTPSQSSQTDNQTDQIATEPTNETTNEPTAEPSTDAPVDQEPVASLSAGRYESYETSKVASEGYNETILFFHAPWCPECRAFEKEITARPLPDGVQILKVDYDSSDDLKSDYGVTLQSTFVKVASNGSLITKWQGYGQDKSVTAILENT